MAELAPLKLDKARFRVAVTAMAEDKAGPDGGRPGGLRDRHQLGAPFGDLGAIASGGSWPASRSRSRPRSPAAAAGHEP